MNNRQGFSVDKSKVTILLEIDCDLLQILVGAAVTDHDFILAWYHTHGVGLRVPTLETAVGQVDGDGLSLARSQLYLLGTKRLLWTFHICRITDIHLNSLQTCRSTCVLDAHLYFIVFILGLADLEVCVAKAIAEGE